MIFRMIIVLATKCLHRSTRKNDSDPRISRIGICTSCHCTVNSHSKYVHKFRHIYPYRYGLYHSSVRDLDPSLRLMSSILIFRQFRLDDNTHFFLYDVAAVYHWDSFTSVPYIPFHPMVTHPGSNLVWSCLTSIALSADRLHYTTQLPDIVYSKQQTLFC